MMAVPQTQQISYKQYIFYIYKAQIGIGILTLPCDLAGIAGTDGWISLLLGWAATLAASFFVVRTMQRHPDKTLYELLPALFGKWIGKLLSLAWIVNTGLTAGIVLYSSVFIIQVWILRNTSHIVLIAAFLLPIYLISRCRLQVQGRYAEFIYLFTLWMPPFLLFSLKDAHYLNLLPVLKEGIMPVLNAVRVTALPFLGFELVFFLHPFLKDKSKAFSGLVIANSMTLFLYLIVVLVAFVYFSEGELHAYVWPTLQLLKSIMLPFVERFEIVFLAFYLLIFSQTIIPYLYFSSTGIAELTGMKKHAGPLLGLVLLYISGSFFLEPTLESMEKVAAWHNDAAIFLGFLFPALLWGYSRIASAVKGEM